MLLKFSTLQGKIPFIYSQKRNCATSVPISTFMCLWAISVCPHIFLQQNWQTNRRNIQIAHRHMNVEIGNEAAKFLFWEFFSPIFGILSLQCTCSKPRRPHSQSPSPWRESEKEIILFKFKETMWRIVSLLLLMRESASATICNIRNKKQSTYAHSPLPHTGCGNGKLYSRPIKRLPIINVLLRECQLIEY